MKKIKNLMTLMPILLIVGCGKNVAESSANLSSSSSITSSSKISSNSSITSSSKQGTTSSSASSKVSSSNSSSSKPSSSKPSSSSASHSHNILPTWYKNGEQHWKECAGCDEVFEKAAHTFGAAIETKAPSCSDKGQVKYVCNVCSYEKFEDRNALSHNFETEWHSDSETHWHACLNDGCSVKSEETAHTWVDNPGDNTSLICSVCNKTKLKDHTHNFDESEIVTKDNGTNIVYGYGCSCGDVHEIDFSGYSIKLGASEETAAEFTPYTIKGYAAVGTLKFNPNTTSFELQVSGDHSSEIVYVDSTRETNPAKFVVKVLEDNTKLGGINFVGNGKLTTKGSSLEISKGYIGSGAEVTAIENDLSFVNDNKEGTAITLTNGTLKVTENGSISISGYDQGIALGGDSTTLVSLDQVGDINITNCKKGILGVIAESSFEFKGNTSIITDGYPVRANNGLHVKVIDGTHTWKSTTSSTVFSVLALTVGGEGHNPQLNIISNGGSAISDQSNDAQNRFEFVSGTTNISCENANSDNSTIGFKVTGEDRIYIRKNATLNMDNFPVSIKGFNNITNLNIHGTLKVTNVKKVGIQEVTINVGSEDKVESGTLYVEATGVGTEEENVDCLYINNYERINFYAGTALLVGSGTSDFQSGLYFEGCDLTKFRVEAGFKLGCADMKYGINNHGSPFFGTYDRIANLADYHYFNLEDCAWYCGDVKKGFTKHTTSESFKEVFGSLYNR